MAKGDADRISDCCEKILDVFNEDRVSRYVAVHSLGAACVHVLASLDNDEIARELFDEMAQVVGKTLALSSKDARVTIKTREVTH